MSQFRNIWAKALQANQAMALRQDGAEAIFDGLVFQYPNDGMVLYERAEAFEYRGQLDRAAADYRRAAELFPLAHWRAVAERGLARVQQKKSNETESDPRVSPQWEAFHVVHTFPHAPHDTRLGALSAIQRIDSEAGSAAVGLRVYVEEVQRHAARLCVSIPDEIEGRVAQIRRFGNKGAHEYPRTRQYEVNQILNAFIDVMRWAGSAVWGKQVEPFPRSLS